MAPAPQTSNPLAKQNTMGPMAPIEDTIEKPQNLPPSKPPPSQTIKGYEGPPKA